MATTLVAKSPHIAFLSSWELSVSMTNNNKKGRKNESIYY